jgi:hypothetical protein
MRYVGSCHCGDNRFEVEGKFGAAIECNCSHCSRKGGVDLDKIERTPFDGKSV